MIRRSKVRSFIAATSCALALTTTAAAGAEAASSAPPPADSTVSPAQVVCFFETRGDRVHISGRDASGHGWWININCPSGTKAVVTVQLQEHKDGDWRNVGTVGRATVFAGGGRGRRATGRAHCTSTARKRWRSVIDVDLVGRPDDPRKLTTQEVSLPCTR